MVIMQVEREKRTNDDAVVQDEHAVAATTSNPPSLMLNRPKHTQTPMQTQSKEQKVDLFGSFPGAGSRLGPFFCLGRLGRGTFSSVHRCIDLRHFHNSPHDNNDNDNNNSSNADNEHRIVLAKVELSNFANTVVDSEAAIFQHLHQAINVKNSHSNDRSVPVFMGHYRCSSSNSTELSAIVMEYLRGEDMHVLRNRRVSPLLKQPASSSSNSNKRRLTLKDAVYLTADAMLPLLKQMHDAGVVHKDVKPSNFVRVATSPLNKTFLVLDFGLSKSIVVPQDSPYADPTQPWDNAAAALGVPSPPKWNIPPNCKPDMPGYLRKERLTAEFRGTSMYASLRVHQSKDYSRRDDMWSLLYVFCDLVSGGLPWMSYAGAGEVRDREACRKLKELIHGEATKEEKLHVEGAMSETQEKDTKETSSNNKDQTEQMLMGDEYHISKYMRDMAAQKGEPLPPLVEPLSYAKDAPKVQLLRDAFAHVAQLNFCDRPDYEFIQSCLYGFLKTDDDLGTSTTTTMTTDAAKEDSIQDIDWETPASTGNGSASKKRNRSRGMNGSKVPKWDLLDYVDPCDEDLFYEAEQEAKIQVNIGEPQKKKFKPEETDMARLPLFFQFRLAQMEYNTNYAKQTAAHFGLRDWFKVVFPLLYGKWDSQRYERGGHRTDTDGYRREAYLKLLEKCIKSAQAFSFFRDRSCIYKKRIGTEKEQLRNVTTTLSFSTKGGDDEDASRIQKYQSIRAIACALSGLRHAIKAERQKKFTPPPVLSFSSVGLGEKWNFLVLFESENRSLVVSCWSLLIF